MGAGLAALLSGIAGKVGTLPGCPHSGTVPSASEPWWSPRVFCHTAETGQHDLVYHSPKMAFRAF